MSELDDVRNSLADTLRKNYLITVSRWSSYRKLLAQFAKDTGVAFEITDERGGLMKKEVVLSVNGSEDKQSKFKFLLDSSFENCTRI